MAEIMKFEKANLVKLLKVIGGVSSAVGAFVPFSGLAGSIIKEVANYMDDEDIENLKCKFQTVNQGLDKISDEIHQVSLQVLKEVINLQYSMTLENLQKQFCNFMEVLEVEPGEQEDKKQAFIKSYEADGGDNNMHHLYNGVVMENQAFNHNILAQSDSDKEAKKALCERLSVMFCIGLIAMMGYYHFMRDDLLSRYTDWEEMMKKVNSSMEAYLNE